MRLYFYENGKLEWEKDFLEGKYEGEWIGYHKSGHLYVEREDTKMEKNKVNGLYITKNGALKQTRHYQSGNKEGEWISYYVTGQVKQVERYKNGKEEGYGFHFMKMASCM